MIVTADEVRRHDRRSTAFVILLLAAVIAASAFLSPSPILTWAIITPMSLWGAWELHRALTRRYHRRLELMNEPFPDDWRRMLQKRVAFYRALEANEAERERFEREVLIFLEEIPIAGVGILIDDETRLLVAASAIIPVFGFPRWEYGTLREVLVTKRAFDADMDADNGLSLSALGMAGASGVWNGVVVLSQADLRRGFIHSRDGDNVGIHEFSHLIDKGTGDIDGVPLSLPPKLLSTWLQVMRQEIDRGRDGESDLDDYGFTSEEEFFAVVSEVFFESPEKLRARHREVYDLMTQIYRQDPARKTVRKELSRVMRRRGER